MSERRIWNTVLQYVYTLRPAKSTLNYSPGKVPIPGKSLKTVEEQLSSEAERGISSVMISRAYGTDLQIMFGLMTGIVQSV